MSENETPEPEALHPVEPGGAQHLVPFDLDAFQERKALWAANFFILWPLGLSLTITLEDHDIAVLDVREWSYPDGEQIETINQVAEENQADFEVFLGFVRERLLAMKVEERSSALHRFERHSVASGDQLISAAP